MRSEDLTNLVNSQLEGRVLESKRKLIDQLRTNSVFLDDHNADLTSVWDQLSGKVTGFYETENSPTMQKVRLIVFLLTRCFFLMIHRIRMDL